MRSETEQMERDILRVYRRARGQERPDIAEFMLAALEKLDAPVRFTKLTDEETPESPPYVAYMEHHNAWTPAYKVDSPMWAWLFAQSREEGP